MASNNYVPTVDYTSRDYSSILQDMISLIPTFAPNWTSRDASDFGIALLELFSYMGDILNYYIDRSANEAFIATASQRENVLAIANLLGYAATDSTAATVTLTFYNSTGSPISVPALTQVATSNVSNGITSQVIYETNTSITVPAASGSTPGSTTVKATQGVTVSGSGGSGELVGTSDGTAGQSFALSQQPVINDSISVVIGGVNYEQVQYLIDYQSYDPVFVSFTDAYGITYVNFGDNVSGRIPPASSPVYVTYRVGGGSAGNVAAGTINYIISFPTGSIPAGLTVSNPNIGNVSGAATGGADPESTDSIRVNAPLSIKALNRAVSVDDYSSLALQVTAVEKATAVGSNYKSITLYFVPYGDTGLQSDGVTPSTVFNSLVSSLQTFFTGKTPPGTTITYQPATYVPVNAILNVTVLPQYNQLTVQTSVQSVIASLLNISNVSFADRITVQDFYSQVSAVEGVAYAQIQKLARNDQDYNYTATNSVLSGGTATLTLSVPTATVTAASASGGVVTYTASNTFSAGQTVTITGLSTSTFNLANAVIASATSSQFTVISSATGTPVTGASATAVIPHKLVTGSEIIVNLTSNTAYNGIFIVNGYTTTTVSYALAAGNISSASATGTVEILTVNDIVCAFNEIPQASSNGIVVNALGGITG